MSAEKPPRHGHRGRMASSPSLGDEYLPDATTSSQAVENFATDNSTQFNSDVGRQVKRSLRRDTFQTSVENYSAQDGRLRAEQGHLNLNIQLTQNIRETPQHSQATTPVLQPRTTPSLKDIKRPHILKSFHPERSRSRSRGDVPEMQPSPSLPTPTSASSSSLPGLASNSLTQENQQVVDSIQKKISEITSLYKKLPKKFARIARFNRLPRLDSKGKDLNAQSKTLLVTVDKGELISCLERTLKKPRHFLPLLEQDIHIKKIQNCLNSIHKLLGKVDGLADQLATTGDKIKLTLRQRTESGNSNQGRPQLRNSPVVGRGGIAKKPQRKSTQRLRTNYFQDLSVNVNNLEDLSVNVNTLATEMVEFRKLCQRLQPPEIDTTIEVTSIPPDLELTKAVAVMLCKALCQVCPNENHAHQVLFGISTQELSCDDSGDTGVEFNLAFECPNESETWFVVQSTMKGQDDEGMEVDDFDTSVRPAPHSRLSFSHHLKDFSHASAEPNARFCLQYYKQGTDDLAVALKHSDFCKHEVFYPDRARLKIIQDSGEAIPLRQLLEKELYPMQQLEMLQKVRLARMLAEAVLKFHSPDWLSCKWDWDNILIYKIDGCLEPHLRFELRSPESAGKTLETAPRSKQMSYVLSQLGVLLGNIAVGPNPVTYEKVHRSLGSTVYAEIIETCRDMSQNENGLGDQDMQERFYTKVVANLIALEKVFNELGNN